MLDSSSLYVTDENGNEKRMEILFTFEDEEHKRKICSIYGSRGRR